MINLRHFIEAKQIKFVPKIITSEPKHWNIIGKYWLSSFDQRDTILETFFFAAPYQGVTITTPFQILQRGSGIVVFHRK